MQKGGLRDGLRALVIRHRDLLACAALALAACLAYCRLPGNGFVNMDDPLQLLDQVHVLTGLTWDNLLWSFSLESWCGPLTWLAYTACYEACGLNPGAFHILNLAIHLLAGITLFIALRRMTGAFWRSAFVSAIFTLHPVNVESVAWAAELNNVLSGLFFMLVLLAYHWYTRKPGWKRYVVALGLFELGLLAKPVLMTLPFILLLVDLWPLGRIRAAAREGEGAGGAWRLRLDGAPVSRLILEKIPFLILALGSFLYNVKGANIRMGLYGAELTPLGLRLSNAAVSSVKYLGKLFWPHDLAVFYPYPDFIPLWQAAGAFLVLTALTVAFIRAVSRRPHYLVGWLWFLGILVPFLGIFQAGLWPEMADRYAYLSSIGIFIALSWGMNDLRERCKPFRLAVPAAGSLALLALAVLTWVQVGFWKDSITLFTHTLASTRNNFVAHNNLGSALLDRGHIRLAIDHFERSIAIKPFFLDAHSTLGRAYYMQGRYDEAIDRLRTCIRINPGKAFIYANLGNACLEMGRYDEAIDNFDRALGMDPVQERVWYRLGEACMRKGDLKNATRCFREAVRIMPGYADAANALDKAGRMRSELEAQSLKIEGMLRADPANPVLLSGLGDIHHRAGEYDKALARYREALSMDPALIQALYGIAAASSNTRDFAQALDALERIRRLQPGDPAVYYNFACIYARQNLVDESIAWLRKAMDRGFAGTDLIARDPDLANIRNTDFVKGLIKSK